MARRPAIISLGSINADFQVRVDRRPEAGETLVARDFARLGGGKAANVAFQAQRLGITARLLGRVGDDELAEQALGPLRDAGVDLSGVGRAAGCATGVAMITVPPGGKKGIVLAPNANLVWEPDGPQSIAEAVRGASPGSVLVFDLEIPKEAAEAAAEAAAAREFVRVLDPSPADAVGERLLGLADVVLPNPVEARTLAGIEIADARSAGRAAMALAQKGPRSVCVKLPEGGCVVCDNGRLHRVDAPLVDPIDTTGAGDVFAGVLASWLARGEGFTDAARAASAASAHAVMQYGSQAGCPSMEDIEARLGEVKLAPLDADER